jgi:hypothetical protein
VSILYDDLYICYVCCCVQLWRNNDHLVLFFFQQYRLIPDGLTIADGPVGPITPVGPTWPTGIIRIILVNQTGPTGVTRPTGINC